MSEPAKNSHSEADLIKVMLEGFRENIDLRFKSLEDKLESYQTHHEKRISEIDVRFIKLEAIEKADYDSLNSRAFSLEGKMEAVEGKIMGIEDQHTEEGDKKDKHPLKKLWNNIIVVGGTALAVAGGGVVLTALWLYIQGQLKV